MQTLNQIKQLDEYNAWANELFLRYFQNSEQPDRRAVRVFAHLLLAEKTWLRRMTSAEDDTTGFDFWASETVADCRDLHEQNRRAFAEFFTDLNEEKLDSEFEYKNSRGATFKNTAREALTHLFLHSVYHRGQAAQAIRLQGEDAPPVTDFIQFLRQ